jgi:hypothetical protein
LLTSHHIPQGRVIERPYSPVATPALTPIPQSYNDSSMKIATDFVQSVFTQQLNQPKATFMSSPHLQRLPSGFGLGNYKLQSQLPQGHGVNRAAPYSQGTAIQRRQSNGTFVALSLA